ncbi:MAG TPA: menaquinone biosynthesis decarboxylase [Acidobacteriota bacterium]|nr:menaquinone biosynthesis decarboxylase [Acidobacteriota bacterium]
MDLRSFVDALERAGELRRVQVSVDARLEITAIADRVVKEGGPALLFENVEGARHPLLINALGSERRVELALGRPADEIGAMLLATAEGLNPPSPRAVWQLRSNLMQLLPMRTRRVRRGPCQEVVEASDLSQFPVQTCWPEDGGPFITFGLVITRDPLTGERNVGVYRLQVHDRDLTGMHWQINKGGGFHYSRAEELGQPLPVAVVIGVDPALLLSAVAALPEGMDEIGFSGILRGAPCPMVRCSSIDLEVPANAEIVLEGEVLPGERRLEGPFGDHFGHYSHAAPFPVFKVRCITRRRRPIYLSAVVGLPPQEDKFIGNATQDILGPLIKVIHHEIVDLWAYFEAGFHNLLVVSVRQRFYKEAVKTALALMGTGQLALTKCLVLVDEGTPVRDFNAVLRAVQANFEPERDFLLLPGVPLDTLDFTSYRMNLGSKMILDASSGPTGALHGAPGADQDAVRAAMGDAADAPEMSAALRDPTRYSAGSGDATRQRGDRVPDPRGIDDRVTAYRVLEESLMLVRVSASARAVVERLVDVDLGPVRIVAALSDDVDLDDPEQMLWGLFTRFDCARDVVFERVERRGPWTTCYGTMGIDATFKPGYPGRLLMPDDLLDKVNRRWAEYGLD